MSHFIKAKRIISKQNTIDAFFKKKDVSNSKIRTPMAIETNVDTLMPDEHPDPSKCSRIQSEEIDCDPGSRKQICEFSINKQDEIRRVYLKEGPYQPKNIDYPCNNDTHRRRFQPSWFESAPHVKIPGYASGSMFYSKFIACVLYNSFYLIMWLLRWPIVHSKK